MSRTHGWLLIASLAFSSAAIPADFKIDTVAGKLVMNVDVNWTLVEDLPKDMDGITMFRVGDGSSMQWLIAPANSRGIGLGAGGDVRDLTIELQEELESQGGVIEGGLQSIQTDRVRGFYIKAVDPSPGPDEWKFTYTGWVAVDSHPVMFNIVWDPGGQTSADRALATVRSMRLQR
jgi:hypothetical protein